MEIFTAITLDNIFYHRISFVSIMHVHVVMLILLDSLPVIRR